MHHAAPLRPTTTDTPPVRHLGWRAHKPDLAAATVLAAGVALYAGIIAALWALTGNDDALVLGVGIPFGACYVAGFAYFYDGTSPLHMWTALREHFDTTTDPRRAR